MDTRDMIRLTCPLLPECASETALVTHSTLQSFYLRIKYVIMPLQKDCSIKANDESIHRALI